MKSLHAQPRPARSGQCLRYAPKTYAESDRVFEHLALLAMWAASSMALWMLLTLLLYQSYHAATISTPLMTQPGNLSLPVSPAERSAQFTCDAVGFVGEHRRPQLPLHSVLINLLECMRHVSSYDFMGKFDFEGERPPVQKRKFSADGFRDVTIRIDGSLGLLENRFALWGMYELLGFFASGVIGGVTFPLNHLDMYWEQANVTRLVGRIFIHATNLHSEDNEPSGTNVTTLANGDSPTALPLTSVDRAIVALSASDNNSLSAVPLLRASIARFGHQPLSIEQFVVPIGSCLTEIAYKKNKSASFRMCFATVPKLYSSLVYSSRNTERARSQLDCKTAARGLVVMARKFFQMATWKEADIDLLIRLTPIATASFTRVDSLPVPQ